jgi:hypothetical protein
VPNKAVNPSGGTGGFRYQRFSAAAGLPWSFVGKKDRTAALLVAYRTGPQNRMTHTWVYDKESFYDFLGFVITYAPDFPEEDFLESEEQLNLDSAFEELKKGLAIVNASHSKASIDAMNELVLRAYDCFKSDDEIEGTRFLGKLDDMLHPNRYHDAEKKLRGD